MRRRLSLSGIPSTDHIAPQEIEAVIKQLEAYSAADFYESNKAIMKLVSDSFLLKREDGSQKDLYLQLIDCSELVEQVRGKNFSYFPYRQLKGVPLSIVCWDKQN